MNNFFKSSRLIFVALIVTGLWSIFQSRSSTAAIGIVFLFPYAAVFTAFFSFLVFLFQREFVFGQSTQINAAIKSVLKIIIYACWLAPIWIIVMGYKTIELNRQRDQENALRQAQFLIEKKNLQDEIQNNKDQLEVWLNTKIQQAGTNSIKLSALSELNELSENNIDLLLEKSDHFGWWLLASRPAATQAQLEKMYNKAQQYDYIFVELCKNPHLSENLFRRLFEKRSSNLGISYNLRNNPNTPKDLLQILEVELSSAH